MVLVVKDVVHEAFAHFQIAVGIEEAVFTRLHPQEVVHPEARLLPLVEVVNGADAKPIFALQIEYYAPFVEFLNVDALLRAQLHLVLVSHHDAQKSLFAL